MPQSSPTTPLASGQVNHDRVSVELVEPDGVPPIIRISWPARPTIIDPKAFPDTAAAVARLFATASTELVRIKASRRL